MAAVYPPDDPTVSTLRISKHDEDLADMAAKPWPLGIGDRVRYNRATGKWYAWRDFYWSSDDAHAYNLLVGRAHSWLLLPELSQSDRQAVLTLFDVRKQKSVMEALSRRETVRLNGDEFDQVPHLLAVQNGVIDLRTATFSKTGNPTDYVSKRARVKWDPDATAPRFVDFLTEIMSGDSARADYLAGVLAYALFGHQREQKFWLFIGHLGGNGKGTLMKVLHWMLGEYSTWPDASLYVRQRRDTPSAREGNPAFLDLQGIRFAPMSEPAGGGEFNDELVKAHTGDDPIRARALYSNDYVEFRPTHTIVIAANKAPKVSDIGGAMRQRVRVIDFRESFRDTPREDKDLETRLKGEAPGILTLLVKMAARYHQSGHLEAEPQDVTDASSAYIESNDQLVDFVAEACATSPTESATSDAMWTAYEAWVGRQAGEVAPLGRTPFGELLGKRFEMKRVSKKKFRTYFGVRPLRTDELAESGVELELNDQ